jgi:hypothetical protein
MPLQAQADQDLVFQVVKGTPAANADQDLVILVAQRLVPATIIASVDQDLVFRVVQRIVDLVQLVGGGYQDFLGNPLANGYLLMNITNPVEIYTVGNDVIEGNDIKFKITLDSNGNVSTSPAQYVYSTSSLTPSCTYTVQGYAADGTTATAPQTVAVPNTSVSYDVSNWVPNWPAFS